MCRKTEEERERECTLISALISNWLHDTGILDPNALADELASVTCDAVIDGDIDARIRVRKKCYGPAYVEWELWPGEPGRRTHGIMTIYRFTGTKASLEPVFYVRSRKRSHRLATMHVPYAKWGLRSSALSKYGIETTY
jgi:hypothetical protein